MYQKYYIIAHFFSIFVCSYNEKKEKKLILLVNTNSFPNFKLGKIQ